MSELFTIPEKIPDYIKEASIYRTTKSRTFSRRESNVEAILDKRVKFFSELYKINEKPKDLGSRIFLENEDYELEIYRASDSILLSHKKFRYRSTVPKGIKLPEEKEAYDLAINYLNKLELNYEDAKDKTFKHTMVANFSPDDEKPQLVESEAHVIFSFILENVPVIGPGAKIKISLVEDGIISGLLYFWRFPIKEEIMPIIEPKEALKRLMADRSFSKLSPKTASVELHSINFAYYALTPTDFQRFLIPVYVIKGTVKTEFLKAYDFTSHVIAVDISLEEIKKRGVVDNPYKYHIF